MAYRIETITMTLSHLQGNSALQAFSNVIFLFSDTADDKISTDIVRRTILL